jgi:hypothetical protein
MTLPVIMATGFLPSWGFALHIWLQPVKMLLKPYSFQRLFSTVKNIFWIRPTVAVMASGGRQNQHCHCILD